MTKHELKMMTWKECDEAFKTDPVVVIPLGSMEVHGPHSPVGDFMISDEVAKSAAERTGAYVVPGVPFGHSEYFRAFPGTISVAPDTLYHYVSDICVCLMDNGVKKILFLNGHAGNNAALEKLARDIRRERGLMIPRMDMWAMLSRDLSKEVYGDNMSRMGHGGGPVDTIMKYLHPEAMRMDLYDKSEQKTTQWQQFPVVGLGKTKVHGSVAFMPYNMEDISAQGALGSPDVGDADGGKRFFDWMVDCCSEFIELMQKSDMQLHEE